MLIAIAREYGSEINNAVEATGARTKAFEILIKLHARSCQVSEEIICLLGNGFADGAMARWRTLHEIVAVGYLIGRHGDELAERYVHHQAVETRKAAREYQRNRERLGQEPLSQDIVAEIEANYESVRAMYGSEFKKPQGWAAKHLGMSGPRIADLQEAAGIDHLAPYYRMASHNVHANPKGVFFKLGLIGETDTLLTGLSNAGLADPGHATALSFGQICSVLLHFRPTIDNLIAMKIMHTLADEIGDALVAANEKLMDDEMTLRT